MNHNEHISQTFEELVRKILEVNSFSVQTPESKTLDFLADYNNEKWAIEVKYYRTARAQIPLIESAATKLIVECEKLGATRGILVASCYIPLAARIELEGRYKIAFADRTDLEIWASKDPDLLDKLAAYLNEDPIPGAEEHGRNFGDVISLTNQPPSPSTPVITKGADLCKELRELQAGKNTWSKYEDICDRILHYLFPNNLHGWHKQLSTEGKHSRFDYVCRIKPSTEFWQFLLDNLNSRYITFEFKNYTEKIKQGQVLTTEKYLLEKALRRVAIIITRKGADEGANAMIQGAMREHGKLILVIEDNHVCEMLHMKDRGDDPSDLLFDIADYFLLTLPR
ncbi:hypothetical protein GCM10007907_20720 [Chitinimonas prasina]|uniref:Restriction endonuclease n=1 Tax=Chitinimonas prasina TaxID=1434937 RepID=A0ABQ5YFL9_9NEIS|nr:hypothetical protein [Chitinimonas prasina]GLR13282.1 hypothetical protein GCM10007907_20720 [Chitinimonas prasina]